MAWISCGLLVVAAFVAVGETRSLSREPLSIVMDSNGAPILMMSLKKQPTPSYPHKTMMFTGYYHPIRSDPGPLTGVFAQGNAVSGGSYLGGRNPNYLQSGPEPADDTEVSSAEAEAAPNSGDEGEQGYSDSGNDEDPQPAQPQQQDEIQPYGTEAPVSEKPIVPQNHPVKYPSKAHKPTKHNKKTAVPIDEDEEEVEEEEEEESEEEEPYKTDRGGQVPNLNNFFPMVFRFPSSYGHRGSESDGSPPGMITAIANSYSTGKGGVASSVATAYGGSSHGKKKRAKSSQE
ncbi:uncharacterized protein LOC107037180 [Diachasma alloeum]|uniref:uncharacterized protein LOC107037180 n=1 Tax=Diachasma alloeum TaxID=454923 RepID=UPI00073834E6|nr:uncharacterized protein LOC107037180 [Diachasma alloeum]